jgi:hypothetical protein
MSFQGLLNQRCSYRRPTNIGTNVLGEIQLTDLVVGSDVMCARQPGKGLNMQQFYQSAKQGTANVKLVRYYFLYSETIQEGDIIDLSDTYQGTVRNVIDAAGRQHHKEVMVEEVESVGEKDKTSG